MQRDRIRNRREPSAERSMAIIYIMVVSFLVARHTARHPENSWHVTRRLVGEVTVVAVRHFFSFIVTVSHSEEEEEKKNYKIIK